MFKLCLNQDFEENERKKEKPHNLLIMRLLNLWELRDSNPRPSACKADALNQLS